MNKLLNKDWWLDVLERMIKTFAQTMLSLMTVGQAFTDINWIQMMSVAGVAALMSLLTSIATIDDPMKYIEVSVPEDPDEELDEELDEEPDEEA